MENNIIEILPITPPKLPNDYFDKRGRFISVKLAILRLKRKIERISGVDLNQK